MEQPDNTQLIYDALDKIENLRFYKRFPLDGIKIKEMDVFANYNTVVICPFCSNKKRRQIISAFIETSVSIRYINGINEYLIKCDYMIGDKYYVTKINHDRYYLIEGSSKLKTIMVIVEGKYIHIRYEDCNNYNTVLEISKIFKRPALWGIEYE